MKEFDRPDTVCAMVTPLDRRGDVDLGATADLVCYLVDQGVRGLLIGGTTGEGPLLSIEERQRLTEQVVQVARGRLCVVVQTGCMTTSDAVSLTHHAATAGADATAAITPYFYLLSEKEIVAHYLALARAEPDLPMFLYCFPAAARNDIAPQVYARLRGETANILGLKYSGGDFVRLEEYLAAGGPSGLVYVGEDRFLLAALMVGACGPASGAAAIHPKPYLALLRAYLAGQIDEAQRHQHTIGQLAALVGYGRVALIKAAMELRGLRVGSVRAPLKPATPAERARLAATLQALGLIEGHAARANRGGEKAHL